MDKSTDSATNWSFAPPAIAQIGNSENSEIIHSLSAGLIIHRIGCVNYGYTHEARSFSRDLQGYMNSQLSSEATTFVYEEVLGGYGRMHWLVHMKTPSEYGKLLQMVDHDKTFQEIYQGDRLPERGGGNWERMFVQSSFCENIMVPQHGFAKESMDELKPGRFVPPALHQLPKQSIPFLDSSSAGALVIRTLQAKYESRDLARYYLHEWQGYINNALPGIVTSTQFEEIWGNQDKLHMMIHLKSFDDYQQLYRLEIEDEGLKDLMNKPKVIIDGKEISWGGLFENYSIKDVILIPITPS